MHKARDCPAGRYLSKAFKENPASGTFMCWTCGLPTIHRGVAYHPNSKDANTRKAWDVVGIEPQGGSLNRAGNQGVAKGGFVCESGMANVCEELCWFTYWHRWEDFDGIWLGDGKPNEHEFLGWLGQKGKYSWANVISAFCMLVEKLETRGPVGRDMRVLPQGLSQPQRRNNVSHFIGIHKKNGVDVS